MIKTISILATIIFAFGVNSVSHSNYHPSGYCEEKDCAIGEDYIDVEERMARVLDASPYSSGLQNYPNFRTSFFDNLTYNILSKKI